MTSTQEAEGRNEGAQFSFGEKLTPGQTLVTDGFAIKYDLRPSRDGFPNSLRLYLVHPSSTEVSFTREGMVFPAPVIGEELDGFVVSRVSGLSRAGKVFIGESDLDFNKPDKNNDLNLTLSSPVFIGHVVEEVEINYFDLRRIYAHRAKSSV